MKCSSSAGFWPLNRWMSMAGKWLPGCLAAWLPAQWLDLPAEQVSHQAFKACNAPARAVIRDGECTLYPNVMLIAGVAF